MLMYVNGILAHNWESSIFSFTAFTVGGWVSLNMLYKLSLNAVLSKMIALCLSSVETKYRYCSFSSRVMVGVFNASTACFILSTVTQDVQISSPLIHFIEWEFGDSANRLPKTVKTIMAFATSVRLWVFIIFSCYKDLICVCAANHLQVPKIMCGPDLWLWSGV